MDLGIQICDFSWPGTPASIPGTLTRIAQDAEAAGVRSLWLMDHYFQIAPFGPPEAEMLEGYSTLAFLAGRTERVELGLMVTGVTHRHPAVLVKTVTTVDVLSGGRAWLGIGAAWNEVEHAGLGIPFPPLRERFERLEETLQIAHRMWAGDESPYTGRHYRLERPVNSPPPVRRPPIMIGGSGERKTLRMVAEYADACNIFDAGLEVVKRKYDVLAEHCVALGRDPEEVRRTVLTRLSLTESGGEQMPYGEVSMSVGEAVQKLGDLAGLGTQTVTLAMGNDTDPAAWELLAEVIRQVA
ncbi:LLM class F420-dependent oxidoreductase [Nocardioides limicola]|uniref:LLM class F420-dependent oxidoreductase n=1 Tax=Nocardioides limicola TaxID=2803368 RepID=UPI00193BEF1F|nr:LLM class F420-dependent oxidoreductase [Nocardioides sp. DJM-14]